MIEVLSHAAETVLGDHSITMASWALTVVTAADAEIGRKIYLRLTALTRYFRGPVSRPAPPSTPQYRLIHNGGGHRF